MDSPPVPRQLDYHQLVRMVGVVRLLVGGALMVAPGRIGRAWMGPDSANPATKVALRAMGVRDLALGAGTLHALSTGASAKSWVALGGMSDAVDALATAVAIRRFPLRNTLPSIGIAVGSAGFAAIAQSRVD